MKLIVVDNKVTFRMPWYIKNKKTFADVPECLAWVGEKMQSTKATADITISNVGLLLPPDQRAAFNDIKGIPSRRVAFRMSEYNEPLQNVILAFWSKSMSTEVRMLVSEQLRALEDSKFL